MVNRVFHSHHLDHPWHLFRVEFLTMIDSILKPFCEIQQLPVDTQYWIATGVCGGLFISAALFRELCDHKPTKIAGCVIGAVAFFAMSAFSHHLVGIVDQQDAILSARAQQGSKIPASGRPQIEIKFSNQSGTTVSFGVDDNGVRTIHGSDNGSVGCDFANRRSTSGVESGIRQPEGGLLRDNVRGVAPMGRLHERAAEWWARIRGATGSATGFEITPNEHSETF